MCEALAELTDLALADLCRLNNDHAVETSYLAEPELARLLSIAFYACGYSGPAAFLIAFDQSAPYVNQNFQFFQQRFEQFVYIDRVITASYARRRGLARKLYEDLFARARAAGHSTVGCEVNLDPPNEASDAFHANLGFEEVGRSRLNNGKTVRYLQRVL